MPDINKISDQANAIANALAGFVAQPDIRGSAQIAFDESHLWDIASVQSTAPRIIVCYAGESQRGDGPTQGVLYRVDRRWKVAVTRGRSLTQQSGTALSNQVLNSTPFYDLVEQVRDGVRSLLNISMERPVDFSTIEPMSLPNLVIDGYLIEFSTANDIPMIVSTPPNPAPPIDAQSQP